MTFEGLFAFRRAPAEPADNADLQLEAIWSEHVVSAAAVAAAVFVVVLIAVLMGTVGP
jgi:hypothetical protein